MILKNNLYNVTSEGIVDGKQCYTISLDSSCFIFKAHFPGMPITPGVCIIQIAKELLERKLGRALEMKAAKNVKFLSVLSPEEQAFYTYRFDKTILSADGNEVKAQAVVLSESETKAKISFTCITKE